MTKSGDTPGGVRKRSVNKNKNAERDSHKKKSKSSRKEGKSDDGSDWKVVDW